MRKVLAVIRREFMTRVRTRAFIISTILGPVLMASFWVIPIYLARRDTGPKRIAIVDASTGQLGARLETTLAAAKREGQGGGPRYEVVRLQAGDRMLAVRDSLLPLTAGTKEAPAKLDGILLVNDSVLQTGRLHYLGTNVGSPADMGILQRIAQPAVVTERLEATGVNAGIVMRAVAPIDLRTQKVSDGKLTNESGEASFALAYVMAFVLYFSLLFYGIQVMSAVVEEKTSRIMEVLVSSLTPFELLLGKVLGVGAVGLLQIAIWAGTATLISNNRGALARAFGAPEAAAMAMPIPTMSGALLAVFLIFFVLGFLLYSAAYAAVGSMCNSTQDTQQAQQPVMMLIILGLFTVFALLGDPNGSMAHTLSLIPFFAPFATPVRFSLSPMPLGDVLLSIGATLAGMLVIVWIASRIYRVGILSYGKRPSLAEVWRWVRTA